MVSYLSKYLSIVYTIRPDKYGRVFLAPCTSDLSIYATLLPYTGQVTFFKRYQKHTAMFNWSACISRLHHVKILAMNHKTPARFKKNLVPYTKNQWNYSATPILSDYWSRKRYSNSTITKQLRGPNYSTL